MTSAQVTAVEQIFRTDIGSGKVLVPNFILYLDELITFDSQRSFVAFDDNEETIVCIRSNNDVYTQVKNPLSISTTSFEDVVCMEALCNMSNFETVLAALCPNMDSDIQEKIVKWAIGICGNVRNLEPMEKRPYYKKEPIPGGVYFGAAARDDLAAGDTVYDQGYIND
jgi:hypothetical protein